MSSLIRLIKREAASVGSVVTGSNTSSAPSEYTPGDAGETGNKLETSTEMATSSQPPETITLGALEEARRIVDSMAGKTNHGTMDPWIVYPIVIAVCLVILGICVCCVRRSNRKRRPKDGKKGSSCKQKVQPNMDELTENAEERDKADKPEVNFPTHT